MLPAHLEVGEEVVGVAGVAGEGQDLLPHQGLMILFTLMRRRICVIPVSLVLLRMFLKYISGVGFPEGLRPPPPPLQDHPG